jgi:hypothetical protein
MAASSGVWETPHKRRHRHGLISGSQTLDPNQGRIQEIERRAGAAALASWRGRISVAGDAIAEALRGRTFIQHGPPRPWL